MHEASEVTFSPILKVSIRHTLLEVLSYAMALCGRVAIFLVAICLSSIHLLLDGLIESAQKQG